jgi:hypothetical protein
MADSRWSLSLDILSARALVWIARRGRAAELTPEAHLYFFDRYRRLADLYRARGRIRKAIHFQSKQTNITRAMTVHRMRQRWLCRGQLGSL